MKKIIAYYFRETELSEVNKVIVNSKVTDSYVIGDAGEADIEHLKKNGIVIKYLEKKEKPAEAKVNRMSAIQRTGLEGLKLTAVTNLVPDLRPTFKPEFPCYFIIYLSAPLIDEYAGMLRGHQVKVVRSLGDDNYVALFHTDTLQRVRDLEFVEYVEYYGTAETLTRIVLDLGVSGEVVTPYTELKTSFYDVLLHAKEDYNEVKKWLDENNYRVIGGSDFKIRILANPDRDNLVVLASHRLIQSIEKYIPPKISNDISRHLLSIDGVDSNASRVSPLLEFEGEGQIVGVADTGIDDRHPDLAGQVVTTFALGRPGDHSDPNGHGTHVTGSIIGNGTASHGKIKGVSPRAKVVFQSLLTENGRLNLPIDIRDLFQQAYDQGVRIHNNSWGAATKSRYTANSNEVDDFVHRHPDMLIIFSAGNDGKGNNNRNVQSGYTDLLSLGSPATAKNALTVGASRNKRTKGGYSRLTYGKVWSQSFPHDPTLSAFISGDSTSMAAFSSRGPVDDGWRIKPDLVAPGTDIASTLSKDADLSEFCGIHPDYDAYALLCGTSMAAPLVTGCAVLVNEYYLKTRQHPPSAALLKATLINSCQLLTGQDGTLNNTNTPHFHQGFGLVNMLRCIPNKTQKFNLLFKDANAAHAAFQIRRNGQKVKFSLTLGTSGWLNVCMTYTDYPGRGLQNNLLLFVDHKSSGTKWIGNDFMPRLLNVIEPTYNVSVDLSNNVQSVKIENAEPGDYTIHIIAHNAWLLPQDYALVVTTHEMTTDLIHLNSL